MVYNSYLSKKPAYVHLYQSAQQYQDDRRLSRVDPNQLCISDEYNMPQKGRIQQVLMGVWLNCYPEQMCVQLQKKQTIQSRVSLNVSFFSFLELFFYKIRTPQKDYVFDAVFKVNILNGFLKS
jgi:hypothetical protein